MAGNAVHEFGLLSGGGPDACWQDTALLHRSQGVRLCLSEVVYAAVLSLNTGRSISEAASMCLNVVPAWHAAPRNVFSLV
jgi:hypothetical protein